MIDSEGHGVLIDWEFAKYIGKPGEKRPELALDMKRHAERTVSSKLG